MTKLAKPLVTATLEVYETIQKELLPTPTKSHYTFNLRDVSKVIQVIPRWSWSTLCESHYCFNLVIPLKSVRQSL